MLFRSDGVTISYGTSILVHDYSIDKALYARRGTHGKLLKSVTIGRNCFIGANTMILPGTVIGDDSIIGGGRLSKAAFRLDRSYAATRLALLEL